HDPLEHHPAGDRGGHVLLLELLLRLRGVDLGQVGGEFLAAKVVRIGVALGAQRLQLRAALLDEFVVVVVIVHRYTACFKLAVMKSSRSPSSTFCVAPFSTPVLRSLMRDWSSTYERIWWPHSMSVFCAASLSCSAR